MRIINWMLFTLLFTTSLSFLQGACADTSGEESPQVFVQTFYSWYVPISLKDGPLSAVDISLKEKSNLFSRELYAALAEDSDVRKKNPGFIAGLDFDPFLMTQDPCEEYEVGKAINEGDKIRVEIYRVCTGKKGSDSVVEVEVSKTDGHWIIDNFYYPPYGGSGGDLLTTLKLLKQGREKSHKS